MIVYVSLVNASLVVECTFTKVFLETHIVKNRIVTVPNFQESCTFFQDSLMNRKLKRTAFILSSFVTLEIPYCHFNASLYLLQVQIIYVIK